MAKRSSTIPNEKHISELIDKMAGAMRPTTNPVSEALSLACSAMHLGADDIANALLNQARAALGVEPVPLEQERARQKERAAAFGAGVGLA